MAAPLTGYLYPWDVIGDPAVTDRLAAAGVRRVALAAAYHSVRAATPHHPAHRVMAAPDAALYVPVRAGRWRGLGLTPISATPWAGQDAFARARDILAAAGLGVDAWAVLTHNTRLGRANPDLCVVNAFGDRYDHALCPSSPWVRDYATMLVREVTELGSAEAILLESAGQLGIEHADRHDKTDGALWTRTESALLSVCCCSRCTAAYEVAGAASVPELIRAALTGLDDQDTVLAELTPVVPAVRSGFGGELAAAATQAARAAGAGTVRVVADPDGWVTGASLSPAGPVPGVDRYLLAAVGAPQADAARARLLADLTGAPVDAHVLLPPDAFPGDLPTRLAALHAAGVSGIFGYHYGLAGAARIAAMTAAYAASPFGAVVTRKGPKNT